MLKVRFAKQPSPSATYDHTRKHSHSLSRRQFQLPFECDHSDLEEVIEKALTENVWSDITRRAQTLCDRFLFVGEVDKLFCQRFKDIASPPKTKDSGIRNGAPV